MENEVLLRQVRENPMLLKEIENPSDELIKVAVKRNGIVIRFVKNPTYEIKKEAIKSNPLSIEYIILFTDTKITSETVDRIMISKSIFYYIFDKCVFV